MTASTLIVIVLIVLLVAAIPIWPYSRPWGNRPVSIIGLVLAILLILMLLGKV